MDFPGLKPVGALTIARVAYPCVRSAVFHRAVCFWTVPELWGIKHTKIIFCWAIHKKVYLHWGVVAWHFYKVFVWACLC